MYAMDFPIYFDGNLRPIFLQENRRTPGGLTDFPLKSWLFKDGILMSWFMVIRSLGSIIILHIYPKQQPGFIW